MIGGGVCVLSRFARARTSITERVPSPLYEVMKYEVVCVVYVVYVVNGEGGSQPNTRKLTFSFKDDYYG